MTKPTVHCWYGRTQDIEDRFGWGSPEHAASWADDYMDGTCMLPDGHDGPHEFTDDDKITVRFADAVDCGP